MGKNSAKPFVFGDPKPIIMNIANICIKSVHLKAEYLEKTHFLLLRIIGSH